MTVMSVERTLLILVAYPYVYYKGLIVAHPMSSTKSSDAYMFCLSR